ncbi:hypothetical protein QTP88_021220 [Uroleucon formosanum]
MKYNKPNRLEIGISSHQAFENIPQKINLNYSSMIYNTEDNVSSTTIFNEVISIVTPVKLPGVSVACSTPDANERALPKGSVNIFPGNIRNMILREKFVNVNNSCVLSIKNINKKKCGEITSIYGYCRHPTCKNFKFEFQKIESAVKVNVFSNQIHYSHGGKLTNILRGTERMSYRKEACLVKPRLKRGHLQQIRSNSVYNRMSQERLSEFDYNSDDRLDMCRIALTHSEFVRFLDKLKPITLNVDATGTVVRNTTLKKKQEKRMLYYAAVVKANGRMMPVAEFISTNQTTTAISKWLFAFKLFAKEHGFQLSDLIKNVTSDFSTDIIKSLAQSLNGCSDVIDYLNQCFDHLCEHKVMQSKIIINLCCYHLVKNISDDVSKYYGVARKNNKNKGLARIVVGLVTPAFDIKTVDELDKWFEALCTVILSPNHNQCVQKCINYLIQLNNNCITEINPDELKCDENILLNSDSMHDLKTNQFSKSKYKASKFYGRFKIMSENLSQSLTSSNTSSPNPFYNEEYFSDLMGSVIPVIPMWTCLMFLQAKGMKCSRFIRLTREHIESVLCDISNQRCAILKKRIANCDIVQKNKSVLSFHTITNLSDDEDVEQRTARKNKKIGYFKQGSLMENMKKLKPIQGIHKKTEKVVDLTTISDEDDKITENNMVTPRARAVKTVDTFPTVTQAFSEISKSFNDNLPEAPISKIDQERIIEVFEHRRKFAPKPIHLAADILNCGSIGSNITDQEQVEAMQFICKVAEDLNYSQAEISAILINLAKYRAKEGLWQNSFVWISAKDIEPALWWKGICGSLCLSTIAHHILSNPATSAATERSFSTQGFIHSKRRNRLLNSRIDKFTFVKQNLKFCSDVKVDTKNVNNLSVNVDTLNQTNYETEIIEVEQTTRAEQINETRSNEESSLEEEDIINLLEGNEDVSTSDSDF